MEPLGSTHGGRTPEVACPPGSRFGRSECAEPPVRNRFSSSGRCWGRWEPSKFSPFSAPHLRAYAPGLKNERKAEGEEHGRPENISGHIDLAIVAFLLNAGLMCARAQSQAATGSTVAID